MQSRTTLVIGSWWYCKLRRIPLKCKTAPSTTMTWKVWCEWPQMSNAPGLRLSGNLAYRVSINVNCLEYFRVYLPHKWELQTRMISRRRRTTTSPSAVGRVPDHGVTRSGKGGRSQLVRTRRRLQPCNVANYVDGTLVRKRGRCTGWRWLSPVSISRTPLSPVGSVWYWETYRDPA